MKTFFCAVVLLVVVLPVQGAYVVRISDLQYSPTPPNPIKVFGTVTSETPLKLTDGKCDLILLGITAKTGDFLVVKGDYASGVLAVAQEA